MSAPSRTRSPVRENINVQPSQSTAHPSTGAFSEPVWEPRRDGIRGPIEGLDGGRGSRGSVVCSPLGHSADINGHWSRMGGPGDVGRGPVDDLGSGSGSGRSGSGSLGSLGGSRVVPSGGNSGRGSVGSPFGASVGPAGASSGWGSVGASSGTRDSWRSIVGPTVGVKRVPWRTVVTTVRRQLVRTVPPDITTATACRRTGCPDIATSTRGQYGYSVNVHDNSGTTMSPQIEQSQRSSASTEFVAYRATGQPTESFVHHDTESWTWKNTSSDRGNGSRAGMGTQSRSERLHYDVPRRPATPGPHHGTYKKSQRSPSRRRQQFSTSTMESQRSPSRRREQSSTSTMLFDDDWRLIAGKEE